MTDRAIRLRLRANLLVRSTCGGILITIMAIRVEPDDTMVFGVMSEEVTVTHTRVQKDGAAATVRPLGTPLVVAAGERLRIPATAFDAQYPSGDFSDTHMDALVKSYWLDEEFQVDCMADDSTVVADSGYSQQTNSVWTFTTETD